jgi:TonB family protein
MAPKASAPGRDSGPVQTLPTQAIPATGDPGPVSPSATSNVLERVEPQYPDAAREQRLQGPVVLNVLVGVDGQVRELKVVSGDSVLAKAATDAVRQWRFRPHRTNDVPVEFETRITVNFSLP